ncbi:hypothetical protein [Streptomyces albiflavescens]|uniref:hypothetical protein n=1 Tax=Streptomyces albiflavescens TaxID=1623582 RepID=UPI001666EC2A|nr:hypothetical protein [Streptomyces albiflavescens]
MTEGTLVVEWRGFSQLDVPMDRCASVSVRPHGQDGGVQIAFRFLPGQQVTAGLVMVRVDVPAQFTERAGWFVGELRRVYGIEDVTAAATEEEPLRRVPRDSAEWVTAPAGVSSEVLYREVFERLAADPAS